MWFCFSVGVRMMRLMVIGNRRRPIHPPASFPLHLLFLFFYLSVLIYLLLGLTHLPERSRYISCLSLRTPGMELYLQIPPFHVSAKSDPLSETRIQRIQSLSKNKIQSTREYQLNNRKKSVGSVNAHKKIEEINTGIYQKALIFQFFFHLFCFWVRKIEE